MPEAVRAKLLSSTVALPRWPVLAGGSVARLAWHPFTPGYAGRVVFTSPRGNYRPANRPDDGYPYPVGWTHLDLHERLHGEWVSSVLPFRAEGYPPIVQPLASSEWLVYDYSHVRVVAKNGAMHATFRTGPAHCLQATSTGRVWIGYGEEQILGSDIGSACFAAFEPDGSRVFAYLDSAQQQGLPIPLNVDALNVVDDAEAWMLGTGEEVKLWDLNTKQATELLAADESGPLEVQRTAGRGPLLYLITSEALYALDVRDLA